MPEGRLLFRAMAYAVLAAGAFVLPIAAGWWAGLFLSYMAVNILIGKVIANFSDAIYRLATRQPVDRNFIVWRDRLELLSDVPDDAYALYASGLSPREARDVISGREQFPENKSRIRQTPLPQRDKVPLLPPPGGRRTR
jgi:hypothetical protein